MNLDTKSNAVTAIYSSNEMNKTAASTQVKRFSDANTSFASEMNTSKKGADNVDETKDSSKTDASDKTSKSEKNETQKTDSKHAEKTSKEQNTDNNQGLNGEISQDGQSQGNQQGGQQNNQNGYTPLSDQVQAYMNANGLDFNLANTGYMNATSRSQLTGMAAAVDYTNIHMSDTDAKFFADLVANTDMSAGSVAAEFEKAMQNGNIKTVQSTAKASAALIEALKESSKTNQPFRIDFDKDISVVLQVDRAGKINANFIPGDKAVENYLRNNIDFLRQRFDEENIAYGELGYSQSRRQKDEHRQNSKENGNE